MNLSQIRVLVAIADTGSLTGAADRLNLSQSGVSQATAALEEDLGVELVTRGRRGAVATAVGEEIVREARSILAGLDAIRRTADAAAGVEQGKLRLAAFPSVFSTLLPPLLRRFKELHPGLEIVALEASDVEIETWLADGTVDLGVTTAESYEATDWPLGQDDWVAVLPSSHPIALSPARAVALTRLAQEPFVLATGGCTIHAGSLAERLGAPLEQVQIEVRDWVSAFALVREGLGVSVVPEPTLPTDRRGLRILPLKEGLHRFFGLRRSEASSENPAVPPFLILAKATVVASSPDQGSEAA
ncbi:MULTISPECIES: LysR family transcriptional regulator [Sulfitobacter]|uniref:LysR family transcriptional regulator n=1 Tax=Sulfitobacter profundi TaxID=2679961 RepID=A0ABW1Z5I1_9RHOB|nr:LysR family transcriptional regulator [Sulfitobacter indolifex]